MHLSTCTYRHHFCKCQPLSNIRKFCLPPLTKSLETMHGSHMHRSHCAILHKKRPVGHIHQKQRAPRLVVSRSAELSGGARATPRRRHRLAQSRSPHTYMHARVCAFYMSPLSRVRPRFHYNSGPVRLHPKTTRIHKRAFSGTSCSTTHAACRIRRAVMIITTGITGMSAQPWKAAFLRLP